MFEIVAGFFDTERLYAGCFLLCCLLFFFQAEDGIRDRTVTGVQTCALPISRHDLAVGDDDELVGLLVRAAGRPGGRLHRSEERRVGKECRYRRGAAYLRKKY